MAVDFADYFWGEKNEGFNVLHQSSKCGPTSARELGDFFRECAKIQDDNSKTHLKILKQMNGSNGGGTFGPLMSAIKPFTERSAAIHHEHMTKLNELAKKTAKYADELSKKPKSVKEETAQTSETVKSIQETTLLLNKSKESYKQRCLEVEKIKRCGGENSSKELEKAETKFRKAQEDYKSLVVQYCSVRETFEKKMTSYTRNFQDFETTHLIQMRDYVQSYLQIVQNFNRQTSQANEELQNQLNHLTVAKLLEQFTLTYHTGLEKPGPIEFEEEKLSVTSIPGEPCSDVSDRSVNSDKLSLGSFNKKQEGSISSGSNVTPSTTLQASTGSGKPLQEPPRLRTWSVARIARKNTSSSDITSDKTSRTTSLLNLFLPNHDKNISSALPPNSNTSHIINNDVFTVAPNTHKDSLNSGGEGLFTKPVIDRGVVNITAASAPATPTEGLDLSRYLQSRGSKCGNLSSSPIPSVSSVDNEHSLAIAVDGSSTSEIEDQLKHATSSWTMAGFLRRRKDKKRKSEKESNPDSVTDPANKMMGSDGEDQRRSETPTPPEVDDQGFSKPPERARGTNNDSSQDPWGEFNASKNNFYSSSSDESDDEDGNNKQKIKVEIKPVSNSNPPISASVDELRSAVVGLDITAPPQRDIFENGVSERNDMRRSQSQSQLINKPSEDLLGLTLHPIDNSLIDKDASTSYNKPLTDPLKMDVSDISIGSNASKEVGDILNELSDLSTQSPSVAIPPRRPTSVQRDKVTNSLIALPRPPSRHGPPLPPPSSTQTATNRNTKNSSSSLIQATESSSPPVTLVTNKSFYGSSRGPSPLTLGMSDVVPLAVAFQEVIHACFRGVDESQCQVRLIGDMMISFPAGIIQMITHNPLTAPLLFRIKNASVLESIVPNKQLISPVPAMSSDGETAFEFNMKNLKELLKTQAELNPGASYFNIDILKYQIQAQAGAKSCPLQLVPYWKCELDHTDLRLNYKYNASAMANPSPLLNLSIAVPIDGGVTKMHSQPSGTWIAENNRALWTFKELTHEKDNPQLRAIRGRFELSYGPGTKSTVALQFNCEGTTLSGVDIELIGPGYRLSLVKKRFVSGKYICDAEGKADSRFRYPFTPSNTISSDC